MKSFKILVYVSLFIASNSLYALDYINELKKSAENGDINSQYSLGTRYELGYDTEENPVEAKKWIGLAAKNGHLLAQLHYGKIIPDRVEGLNWIKRSAKNGYAKAQAYLGELYRTKNNGYIDVDIDQSVFWLKKAAQNTIDLSSSLESSFRLFLMYENGDGVKKDDALASSWLKLTIKNTKYNLKELYEFVSASKGYSNIHFRFLRLGAEMGHPDMQGELGFFYYSGYKATRSPDIGRIIIKKDGAKAIKWLNLAANNGNAEAYHSLGSIYENGMFKENAKEGDWWEIQPNKHEAVKYYNLAAQRNHIASKERLKKRDTTESKSWDDKYDTASSYYINRYFEYTFYKAIIAFSEAGDKSLYFSIQEDRNICDPDAGTDGISDSIWEINKQAISMLLSCQKSHKDFYYIEATPRTNQGFNYVVNAFLKSSGDILIEGSGYSFPISAIGFTKAWNGKSNKAL